MSASAEIQVNLRARRLPGLTECYVFEAKHSEAWEEITRLRIQGDGTRYHVHARPGFVMGDEPVDIIWDRQRYEDFRAFVDMTSGGFDA